MLRQLIEQMVAQDISTITERAVPPGFPEGLKN